MRKERDVALLIGHMLHIAELENMPTSNPEDRGRIHQTVDVLCWVMGWPSKFQAAADASLESNKDVPDELVEVMIKDMKDAVERIKDKHSTDTSKTDSFSM